ncbi:ead/Ea22-like family protein, partial [Escherichia coli]|nr:ead/Ea22-like family protein [Escherichia coli]EKG8271533.1 ead/Ea22-like family protein [Escherichia coli]ELR1933502.1 ead/Ea22-like family protein [Escherichia coli]
MSEINSQALREAAEKAGEDKWQAKKINGDFFVIRHGSYTRQHGYTSYQPIAEIDCKPVRDFVAKANPATVLELLDELEAAKSKLNEQREYYEGVIADGSKRIAEQEKSEEQLINERDHAESALADMYFAATGDRPEWSNCFSFSDAVDAVVDRIADLEAKQ